MNTDQKIHKFFEEWRQWCKIPNCPKRFEDVRYYYAEERLYQFHFPNGAILLATGGSPLDALLSATSEFDLSHEARELRRLSDIVRDDFKRQALSLLRSIEGDIERGYDATGTIGSLINATTRLACADREKQSLSELIKASEPKIEKEESK